MTVPPPVTVKAAFVPVERASPPLKLIVAPVFVANEIPVSVSVIAPLNVTVPPVRPVTLTERALPLAIVAALLMVALPPLTLKALPVAPESAPPLIVNVPVSGPARATLFVPPVDVTDGKTALNTPLVRLSAWPLVLTITSAAVSVPKPEPEMALPLALPPVKPLSVLPVLRVTPLPPAFWMVVDWAGVAFIAGRVRLPVTGLMPLMAESVWVESCPISFCPLNRVTPHV